jgi:hypothetical protein
VQHRQVGVRRYLSQPRCDLVFFLDGVKTIVPRHAAVVLKVMKNPKLQHAHQRPKWIVISVLAAATATAPATENRQK